MTNQKLKVACLNVYHLHGKLADVSIFLDQHAPLHLLGLSETRLGPNVDDSLISIPNYSIFRRDAQVPGQTGLAIYIHNSIQHLITRRQDLESSSDVESMWISVKNGKSSPTLISFIYRNGREEFGWYDQFSTMMDTASPSKNDVILMGDFNIDDFKPHPSWQCTLSVHGLVQLVKSPTRVTATSSTLIDHIYTNNPTAVFDVCVPTESISDHYPVMCSFNLTIPKIKKQDHTTIDYRSFKSFDKKLFQQDLENISFDEVIQATNPDIALKIFYDIFLSILNAHAPLKRKRVKQNRFPPWLTQHLRNAMALRTRLKKEGRNDEYKIQRNRTRYAVREAQKKYVQSIAKDSKNTSQVWQAINSFSKGKKKANQPLPKSLTPDNLNDHFSSVANSLLSDTSHDLLQSSNSDHTKTLSDFCLEKNEGKAPFKIPEITEQDVRKIIKTFKSKKSTGPDGISPKILKIALPFIVSPLTHIYNLCIKSNTFPSIIKSAKVIPLHKAGDPSDPSNYRPISLLSVLSKPLERFVHQHLLDYLEERQLIHPFQSGFRPQHSCQTALSRMTDTWLSNINNSLITGAIFLDFRKAFDLVNHKILINKLRMYLCDESSVKFFESYLTGRTQKVYAHGNHSNVKNISHGVPQGSILGPLLFNIFINDLPLSLSAANTNCDMFADDTSLHTADKELASVNSKLQSSLNIVQTWCNHNSMVLHPGKTKAIVITTRQKHQRAPLKLSLFMDNAPIEQVAQHTLLGVTIDEQLSWKPHVETMSKTIAKKMYLMSKLAHIIDRKSLIPFYHAHIRSRIDYASTVWDACCEDTMRNLNSLVRRAGKILKPDANLSTDEKLRSLGFLPLKQHLQYNKCLFVFKLLHDKLPNYMNNFFQKSKTPYGQLHQLFVIPRPRIDKYKHSLSFSGSTMWNKLPIFIKSIHSLARFKQELKKRMLSHDIIFK